jgi:hypothetical protein
LAKYENERRSVGSSIVCVLNLNMIDIDLMVVEVSGPNNKEEYDHFIKDRLKIAKNLKTIMKLIMRKKVVIEDEIIEDKLKIAKNLKAIMKLIMRKKKVVSLKKKKIKNVLSSFFIK